MTNHSQFYSAFVGMPLHGHALSIQRRNKFRLVIFEFTRPYKSIESSENMQKYQHKHVRIYLEGKNPWL